MKRPPVLRSNTKAICGRCEGACCKRSPGEAHPADFGAPDRARMRESLFEVLSSGMWAIDHWVGDPRQRISADGPIPFDMFAAAIGFRVAESKSVEFVRPATK